MRPNHSTSISILKQYSLFASKKCIIMKNNLLLLILLRNLGIVRGVTPYKKGRKIN